MKIDELNINQYFYDYLLENKLIFFVCVMLLFTYPLQRVILPKYYGKVISSLQDKSNKGFIDNATILLVIYALVQFLHALYQKVQGALVPKFAEFSLRRIFKSILNNDNEDYENIKVGEILAKLTKIPNIVYRYLDILKSVVFSQIIVLVTCIYHYYQVSTRAASAFVFVVCGVVMLQIITYKTTMHLEIEREREQDKIYHYFQDVLNNLVSVLICKTENQEEDRLVELFEPFTEIFYKVLNMNFIMRTIFSFFNIFAFVLLNYILYTEFKTKKITKEIFVSTFIVTYSVLQLFNDSAHSVRLLVDTTSQISDMETFFNTKVFAKLSSSPSADKDIKKTEFVNGDIVFKNVMYQYQHGNSQKSYALDNINLNISKNENIGLVGHIGSGKSTLIKLLLKLIAPTSGEITIGGVDINNISKAELYKHVFYVPQKPKLLNRTLYENIVYGIENPKKEKYIIIIKDTMREMNIDQNTQDKLFQNMDESVGNEGSRLSGGQRQIVWVIRALLRNPSIIIMDEPTASLDKQNKQKILDMIEKIGTRKTVIIVSHDDIGYNYKKTYLKGGKIVESFI